jgi:hypothetical protein
MVIVIADVDVAVAVSQSLGHDIRCHDRLRIRVVTGYQVTETVIEIWMVNVVAEVAIAVTVMVLIIIIVRGVHSQSNVATHGTFVRSRLVAHAAVQVSHGVMRIILYFRCKLLCL